MRASPSAAGAGGAASLPTGAGLAPAWYSSVNTLGDLPRCFMRWIVAAVIVAGELAGVTVSLNRSLATPLTADLHTLVVARDLSDVRTLDPDRVFEPSADMVEGTVYDPLVTFLGQDITHVRPDLAAHWTLSAHNRVYTFHLRHHVRFSNGDPLTAADVVFSYRRLGYLNDNPAFLMGAHTVGHGLVINQVRSLDTYTVQITLPRPDVSFLAALTSPVFGVLDARVVQAHGGSDSPRAAVADKATTWLDDHSAGTGAFVLHSWVRGSSGHITLTRNHFYWGKTPSLRQILLQGIPSAVTQRLEVERGTVDMAFNIPIYGVE